MLDGTRVLDRAALIASLDEQRMIAANKLRGLTRADSVAVTMPSGTTLLGVVKHLAWVEVEWFQRIVAGREVDLPEDAEPDVDASFVLADGDTPDSILVLYDAACAESRAIVEERRLDDVTVGAHPDFGRCTIGWILHHMIRETARHAGHADILRELTDGSTGFM
jgi:hypothetical protein